MKAICTGFSIVLMAFESRIEGGRAGNSWEKRIKHYIKPNLLILDDFAMKEFTKNQAEDLYELIDRRYNSSSMVITANRVPKDWYTIFQMGK